jgi:hypothetical protein
MTKNALFILDDKNLPAFKANALSRAKEFDITNILPMYEDLYVRTVSKHRELWPPK